MKRISRTSHLKPWLVGVALVLLVLCRQSAEAQATNTFPSTGSAGIGTTSPTAPLTISTAGNTLDGTYYSTMTVRKTGDTVSGIRFDKNSTALFRVGTDASNNFQISRFVGTGAPDDGAFYLDQSGNVGIGTATPAARLDVQGTGYFSSVVSLGHVASFARLGQNLGVTNAANYGGMALSAFSAVSADQAPVMDFNRSRSSTVGAYTAVANNDMLGHIIFRGSTGSDFGDFARISGQVDGATSAGGDTPGRLAFWTTPDGSGSLAERMRIDSNGNVGIGTTTPTALLHLRASSGDVVHRLENAGNAGGYLDLRYKYEAAQHRIGFTDGGGNWLFYTQFALPNSNSTAYFPGSVNVAGSINAKYQDVAEWVQSSQELSAGTVVVLDHTKSNQVIASSVSYDTRVAGVISLQPGITLGLKGEGKVLVATTGRVRIRVDASRGAIQVGDLLVTSDVAGVAMKSQPIDVGGVQIHRPGTLIGKALEPLVHGEGEILVLLSLQ